MKYDLGQEVLIECSGESGEVIGRAEYKGTSRPTYLIRYQAADGRAVENWWGEDALIIAR